MIYKFKLQYLSLLLLAFLMLMHGNLTKIETPSIEPVEEVQPHVPHIDAKQIACLAKNIYHEAGNEPLLGQAAVARVVMNRIRHGFGKNPCQVVYQTTTVEKQDNDGDWIKVKLCQFSWVCEGKNEPNKMSAKYKQAEQVAYDVIVNDAYKNVIPKSTLFFHNLTVDPAWPYKQVAKIGNHIFYSKEKKMQNDGK